MSVPRGKLDTAQDILDEEGIDYVVHEESSSRDIAAVVTFPLPTNAVEPVLESFRKVGLSDDTYTVITEASTVLSRDFEALEERYAEEENEDRIAREELTAKAEALAPSR